MKYVREGKRNLKGLSVDNRIILKWIIKKQSLD
jgi:hypothetical protein